VETKRNWLFGLQGEPPPTVLERIDFENINNTSEAIRCRMTELNDYSVPTLSSRCRELKLSYSGTKAQLTKRIAKWEAKAGSTQEQLDEIARYTAETGYSLEQPIINRKYGENFNKVDRFNRLLSGIEYLPKAPDECTRVFVGLVEICIVQAWAACQDWVFDGEEKDSLLSFAKQLAIDLAA